MADEIIKRLRKATRVEVRRVHPGWVYPEGLNPRDCEGCKAPQIRTTKHHLIPKQIYYRLSRRVKERTMNEVAHLCKRCHTLIHQLFSNEQLATMSKEQQLDPLSPK